ncbi:oligogalacturonate lyase family protein [Sphingomonas sp. dw_22]|uniref:oligogalacturonate lyase family protein n=1 Tax=Sphingomonas sp. dw_22 TaxID=2721175 RepID=UPI001BD3FCC6|nr:oligogalacturonate lyase family protein [Sphingomonas sp. dw_22]
MKVKAALASFLFLVSGAPGAYVAAAQDVAPVPALGPKTWVDPLTHHRVVRISQEAGSASLYFHQNSYTPQGDKMVISVPDGIASVELKTWKVTTIVKGADLQLLFTGRKTRTVYYARRSATGSTIFAADIDSGKSRQIAKVDRGFIGSINADETLLLGQWAASDKPLQPGNPDAPKDRQQFGQANYQANGPDGKPLTFAEAKEVRMNDRLESGIPMEIFTIDIKTGARKVVIASSKDWLNHIQFSPTDPNLIMYCHEGPWHKIDRIWTIRTDGTGNQLIHKRIMNMEIAGHEFFSPDGKWIWYDLQTPRGQDFWVGGYELATGKRKWFHLERNEWSVHFNRSPDLTHFSGDGGDNEMVAHAPDGKYLYLFTPNDIPDVAGIHASGSENLISPGYFTSEKLVDMRKHDYRLEPNMTFTPDNKWIVFRSNMEGSNQVYAVEIAKAE